MEAALDTNGTIERSMGLAIPEHNAAHDDIHILVMSTRRDLHTLIWVFILELQDEPFPQQRTFKPVSFEALDSYMHLLFGMTTIPDPRLTPTSTILRYGPTCVQPWRFFESMWLTTSWRRQD